MRPFLAVSHSTHSAVRSRNSFSVPWCTCPVLCKHMLGLLATLQLGAPRRQCTSQIVHVRCSSLLPPKSSALVKVDCTSCAACCMRCLVQGQACDDKTSVWKPAEAAKQDKNAVLPWILGTYQPKFQTARKPWILSTHVPHSCTCFPFLL